MGSEWERDGSVSLSPSISRSGWCRIKPSSESIGIAFLRSETPFRTEIGYRGSYRRAVRDSTSLLQASPDEPRAKSVRIGMSVGSASTSARMHRNHRSVEEIAE